MVSVKERLSVVECPLMEVPLYYYFTLSRYVVQISSLNSNLDNTTL